MKSLTFIEIDNTDDARDVSIPDPSVVGLGAEVVVKDGSGAAGTNNITITPEAGEIDGNPTYVISDNGACVTMRSDGVKWVVTSTAGVGGGAPVTAPSLIHFGPITYAANVDVVKMPMPACRIKNVRYRWTNQPSGANVVVTVTGGTGGTPGTSSHSTASGTITDSAQAHPEASFAAQAVMTIRLEEDDSGNPAAGTIVEGCVEVLAP